MFTKKRCFALQLVLIGGLKMSNSNASKNIEKMLFSKAFAKGHKCNPEESVSY